MRKVPPTPKDDEEREILAHIAEHGCHVWLIDPEPGLPGFAYSVGIQHTCGAPELMVYGLPHDVMQYLVNTYCDRVRAGDRFEPGKDYTDLIEGPPSLRFEKVDNVYYADHFGWNRWFYGDDDAFEVLQLVWPTFDGPYPCDDDAPKELVQAQPLLFSCDCPEGRHPSPGPGPDAVPGQAIVCPHVFRAERPILYVMHEKQHEWQVLCGGSDHDERPTLVHLHHLVELDPTLRELIDLEPGHEAERDAVDAPWRRKPIGE